MKSICVTGYKGYLGSEVFFRLQLMGLKPIGIDKGDKFRKADVIIHLACTNLEGRGEEFIKNEIALTKKVCGLAKKIIFTSSAAVYGNANMPAKEDDKLNPINDYGRAKMECEKVIKESRIYYSILRLANVYSKNVTHGFIKNILDGKDILYSEGERTRDYVLLDDVVGVIIQAALKNKWNGIYNIGTGKNLSARELFSRLSSKKPVYKHKFEIPHSFLDITKARENGFEPFSL